MVQYIVFELFSSRVDQNWVREIINRDYILLWIVSLTFVHWIGQKGAVTTTSVVDLDLMKKNVQLKRFTFNGPNRKPSYRRLTFSFLILLLAFCVNWKSVLVTSSSRIDKHSSLFLWLSRRQIFRQSPITELQDGRYLSIAWATV